MSIRGNVKSYPSKNLFINILTKDVSIEASILDLIDNSVDSYIRSNYIEKKEIKIYFSSDEFRIEDTCGGISVSDLENHTFIFGAALFEKTSPTLGMYGIGMKRSLFKIGNNIEIQTADDSDYSYLHLDVEKWKNDEMNWDIPFDHDDVNSNGKKNYTNIKIIEIKDEFKDLFESTVFQNKLILLIQKTYSRLMNSINFYVNNNLIDPINIMVANNDEFKPQVLTGEVNKVRYKIISYLNTRPENTPFGLDRGWNIYCNDRAILLNDVTTETGWGNKLITRGLPSFHNLYNQFKGIVLLSSDNPFDLPLNTSKSGLNYESNTYKEILKLMVKCGRPIISYINKRLKSDLVKEHEVESSVNKKNQSLIESQKNSEAIPIDDLEANSEFKAPELEQQEISKLILISYKKDAYIVDKLKEYLNANSAKEVGEKTFDYFVKMEEIE